MKTTSSAFASAKSFSAWRRPFGSGRSKAGATVPRAMLSEAAVGMAVSPHADDEIEHNRTDAPRAAALQERQQTLGQIPGAAPHVFAQILRRGRRWVGVQQHGPALMHHEVEFPEI